MNTNTNTSLTSITIALFGLELGAFNRALAAVSDYAKYADIDQLVEKELALHTAATADGRIAWVLRDLPGRRIVVGFAPDAGVPGEAVSFCYADKDLTEEEVEAVKASLRLFRDAAAAHFAEPAMTTAAAEALFGVAHELAPAIDYDPSWANGTGYFNGAVSAELPAAEGVWKTTDEHNRKILIARLGEETLVLFERYTESMQLALHAPAMMNSIARVTTAMDSGRRVNNGNANSIARCLHNLIDHLISA